MKHCLILTPHCRANRQLVLRPLQILLGCLERLKERDSSEVSFFMIFFMILHSYSRIGIIPVLNLSMIDAPCLRERFKSKKRRKKLKHFSFRYVRVAENFEILVFFSFLWNTQTYVLRHMGEKRKKISFYWT